MLIFVDEACGASARSCRSVAFTFHSCMRVGTFYGYGARDFGSRLVPIADSLEGWLYDVHT